MGPLGYLEVLDRRGRVAQRHAVTGEPLTIGRAYDNDVILDDPYVSPHHLALVHHGDVGVLQDLQSENGLYTDGRRRVPELPLTSGLEFRIGHTDLRYKAVGATVAPTIRETRERGDLLAPIRTATRKRGILVATLALFALVFYQSSYDEVTWPEALGGAVGGLVLLGLWAGAWAFAGRVVSHRFRFWSHLAWAALLSSLFLVTVVLGEYVEFLFAWSSAVASLLGVAALALFAGGLFGHFSIVGTMPFRRRVVVTAWISVGIVAAMSLFAAAAEDTFSNEIPWSGTLKPIGSSLLPTVTVEAFRERAARLEQEITDMTEP